jgi:2-oxoglutarate ferredoxin oxidoreductase subunit gamma
MQRNVTLRFAGFGGQGIVKAGELFGTAAMEDGKRALQNASYGSSARGGLCTADVCVGDGELYEVEPDRFDVLVAMNQTSCTAFLPMLDPDGVLVYEQDLVAAPAGGPARRHAIPATRIADEMGRRIVANIVVLGFCGALTRIVSPEALKRTLAANVPKGTEELNLRAFEEGWRRGENEAKV